MEWDYSFFVPKANPFRRQRFESEQEEPATLIVNEANRTIPCTACDRRVGEISGRFYEIDRRCYCFSCGSKRANESKNRVEKKALREIDTVP